MKRKKIKERKSSLPDMEKKFREFVPIIVQGCKGNLYKDGFLKFSKEQLGELTGDTQDSVDLVVYLTMVTEAYPDTQFVYDEKIMHEKANCFIMTAATAYWEKIGWITAEISGNKIDPNVPVKITFTEEGKSACGIEK